MLEKDLQAKGLRFTQTKFKSRIQITIRIQGTITVPFIIHFL
jgi:hypothetical protein